MYSKEFSLFSFDHRVVVELFFKPSLITLLCQELKLIVVLIMRKNKSKNVCAMFNFFAVNS